MIFQKNLCNSGEVRSFRQLIVEFVEHEPRVHVGADEAAYSVVPGLIGFGAADRA